MGLMLTAFLAGKNPASVPGEYQSQRSLYGRCRWSTVGSGEHSGLEHTRVCRLGAEGGIHPLGHSDARYHADVAEEGRNRDCFPQ